MRIQLFRRQPVRNPARRLPRAGETGEAAGCGWFDSSHDLQAGLHVQEHATAEVLPLAAWLELQLDGWRPSQPAACR